jgi:hypothetical protein
MLYGDTFGTIMFTKQLAAGQLPPEIWMIIIDMAVEASIIPDEICTYSNLPRLNQYLHPYGPPIDHSWAKLRLVCRAFKALAGPAPRGYMDRKGVLKTARDVYISLPSSVTACMQQLARDAPNHRIVALTLPYPDGKDDQYRVMQSILQHGPSLPNLRMLTIILRHDNWSKVWRDLNEAFPSLTSLVVHGKSIPSSAVSYVVDRVVFQHLKMLELHSLLPFVGVEFPALRHVSVGRCSQEEMKAITKWPHLESLILRTMDWRTEFDWRSFPNLRLLGLPPTHLWIISRCPYEHPLSHLSLYVTTPGSCPWLVESIMERRPWPLPTKIILNLESITEQRLDCIARGCASAGLQLVGSPYSVARRSALFIMGMVSSSVTYAYRITRRGVLFITGMMPPSVIDGVKYMAEAAGTILIMPVGILFFRYCSLFD